jgi:hypothetical protein
MVIEQDAQKSTLSTLAIAGVRVFEYIKSRDQETKEEIRDELAFPDSNLELSRFRGLHSLIADRQSLISAT